ncbi:Cation-independent mannose-6-phosphate receptor CI-MPR, partial [Spiromyces aspiralis]
SDYAVDGYDSGYKFKLNVCHSLVTSGLEYSVKSSGAAWSRGGDLGSLGKPSEKPFVRGNKLLLEYHGGSQCPDNSQAKQSTVISFICDASVPGNGKPVYVADAERCAFWFEWRTPVACPLSSPPKSDGRGDSDGPSDNGGAKDGDKGEKGNRSNNGDGTSWLGVLFIMLFIVGAVYLMAGVFYNRMFHQSRGLEQIPHYRLWSGMFGFIRDMALILWYPIAETVGSCISKLRGHRGFNYSSMRDGQADFQQYAIEFESDDDEHGGPNVLRYNRKSSGPGDST